MAYKCGVCGKSPRSGKSLSHSHKASNRVFKPNLSRQKVILNGVVKKMYVCTRCLRSGRVQKPIRIFTPAPTPSLSS